MSNEELLTIYQASASTGYDVETLRRLAREGSIRAAKFGRDWSVYLSDVLAYRQAKPQRKPRAEPGRRARRGEGAE